MSEAPIRLLRPRAALDYYDSRSVDLAVAMSPLQVWNAATADAGPVLRAAFRLRDAISALFGVKRINGFSGQRHETIQPGDCLDFFLVEEVGPDLLVLTARDRHLDVMICLTSAGQRVTITASVVTHNLFGRLYMLPVGPAHRMIVTRMLRRIKRKSVTAAR